jgi:hypothetical protein
MASPRDFTLTKHAVDRLRERCVNFAKEVDWIKETALKKKATYEYMSKAVEEKSFLNNSRFMTTIWEKYGFDNTYNMFIRENNVFVGVTNQAGSFIVTVLNRDEHYVPHLREKVKKFAKKEDQKLGVYFPPGRRR